MDRVATVSRESQMVRRSHHLVHSVQIDHPTKVQPGSSLGLEDPTCRPTNPCRFEPPFVHRGHHGIDGLRHIVRHQEHITTSLESHYRHLCRPVPVRESAHDERVR